MTFVAGKDSDRLSIFVGETLGFYHCIHKCVVSRGHVDQWGGYSSRGKLYTMSLGSTKSNIASIVLVASILDYVYVTLPYVNGDDHIGFLCTVYAGLKTAFSNSTTVTLY